MEIRIKTIKELLATNNYTLNDNNSRLTQVNSGYGWDIHRLTASSQGIKKINDSVFDYLDSGIGYYLFADMVVTKPKIGTQLELNI